MSNSPSKLDYERPDKEVLKSEYQSESSKKHGK